ncbi:MAG: electron transfer flavoprotein subunit alpha/FixB family protein [Chloroflexi bacterium]|nr:electron transfer flavoprotein subunit alpha/FixB family protein [Chloroflexota bacterium]
MILTYIEQDREKVNEASFEALTLARQLAEQTNAPLHAITIGSAADELVERLGAFGVRTLHVASSEALSAGNTAVEYAPAAYAQSIVEIIHAQKPAAVLAAGSERGNEIMAHVAAKTNLPMAANCIEVQAGDAYIVTRQRWGGSLFEQAKLKGATKLLTVAPNSIPVVTNSFVAQTVGTNKFVTTLSENDLRTRIISRVETSSGKVSLGEARVVVGGGRGVGSAEGFKILEELADLLGGAVGGSRVVTGLGWRPHADQIGQTGNRIQPELYISCGVSGAIQHLVGAKGAKHILAINTDPDASIMYKADYAVIGDLHQVVPAISAEMRKRRG